MSDEKRATPKSPAELLVEAHDQFDFLVRSSADWDAGRTHEAKRLALTLRILLHHDGGGNSRALLVQTGHRDRLHFLDSAGDFEKGDLFRSPLVVLSAQPGGAPEYRPRFSSWDRRAVSISEQVAHRSRGERPPRPPGRHLAFEEWWEAVVVEAGGREYSRKRFVLAVANAGGGAHVDPTTKADIQALANENAMGWSTVVKSAGGEEQLPGGSPIPAVVRQIAWEVHRTVFNQARDLLPDEHRRTPPRSLPPMSAEPTILIGGFGTTDTLPPGAQPFATSSP